MLKGRAVLVKIADRSVDRDVPAPVGHKRIRRRHVVRRNMHWKLLRILSSGQRSDKGLRELWRLGADIRQAVRRIPGWVRNRQAFDGGEEAACSYANAGLAGAAGQLAQQTIRPTRRICKTQSRREIVQRSGRDGGRYGGIARRHVSGWGSGELDGVFAIDQSRDLIVLF